LEGEIRRHRASRSGVDQKDAASIVETAWCLLDWDPGATKLIAQRSTVRSQDAGIVTEPGPVDVGKDVRKLIFRGDGDDSLGMHGGIGASCGIDDKML